MEPERKQPDKDPLLQRGELFLTFLLLATGITFLFFALLAAVIIVKVRGL